MSTHFVSIKMNNSQQQQTARRNCIKEASITQSLSSSFNRVVHESSDNKPPAPLAPPAPSDNKPVAPEVTPDSELNMKENVGALSPSST